MKIAYLIKNPKENMIVQKMLFGKGFSWMTGKHYEPLQIGKYGTLIGAGDYTFGKNLLLAFVMNTLSDIGSAKKAGLSVKIFNNKLEI